MPMRLEPSVFTAVTQKMKSYSECIQYPTYEERLEYLKVYSHVGFDTFGYDRYLNQVLYKCAEWLKVRNDVIMRDCGCDLAVPGYEIPVKPIIHHINPITVEQVLNRDPIVFDLNNLILTSDPTHRAIHYGSTGVNPFSFAERSKNDTSPWRK